MKVFVFSFFFLCFFTEISKGAEKPHWLRIQCDSLSSNFHIIVENLSDQQISVSTGESKYLLYHFPCDHVSQIGPFVSCQRFSGGEYRQFYSFLRREIGYPESSMGSDDEVTRYHFVFVRSYTDQNRESKQVKRELSFLSSECQVE